MKTRIKKAIMLLIAAIISVTMNGFLIMKLYNWFIATFFYSPQMAIYHGVTIFILSSYLRQYENKDDSETTLKKLGDITLKNAVKIGFILSVAYGIKLIANI